LSLFPPQEIKNFPLLWAVYFSGIFVVSCAKAYCEKTQKASIAKKNECFKMQYLVIKKY
jgi:hypothetical protein